MKVEFTPLAERQLDALYNYIADHSSERIADNYRQDRYFLQKAGRFPESRHETRRDFAGSSNGWI